MKLQKCVKLINLPSMGILMKKRYRTIIFFCCLSFLLIQFPFFTVQSADKSLLNNSMSSSSKSVASGANITAEDQLKATERQDELTRQIRRMITDDNSFSMRARNITIVTLGDKITLKGKVDSKQEKDKITSMVQTMAGSKSIRNDLTYKTK